MCYRILCLTLCFSSLILISAEAQQVRGEASYYADKFHGRPTATGEKYDKNAFTAANKDFPVGSILRVTRVDNGKSVDVRVNDCGPHSKGRIIDLSRAAAEKIGLIRDGITQVELKLVALGEGGFACGGSSGSFAGKLMEPAVTSPKNPIASVTDVPIVAYELNVKQLAKQPDPARFWVQFGAYSQEANARTQYQKNLVSGLENLQIVKDGKLFRIVAGPYNDRFSAEALKYYLEKEKNLKGIVAEL